VRGIAPGTAAATAELKLVTYAPLRDALQRERDLVARQEHFTVHLAVQVDDMICSIVADTPRLALFITEIS
jgi:hypothetical protein